MTQPNKAASLPSHFVRADDGCRGSDGGGFPAVPRSCSKRESLPYRHKQKRDIHISKSPSEIIQKGFFHRFCL